MDDPAQLARLAVACGVPERYAWVEPDESRNDRLAAGASFYAHGESGDGKTTVAARILKGWIAAGRGSARWVRSIDLISEISDTYGGGGREMAVFAKYAEGSPLLVIDDLGKENPGDWSLSKLFQLIDERYGARRPTIITTQFGTSKLEERWVSKGGAPETARAILSRIKETYAGINCGTEDRRLRSGKD